MNSTKIVLTTAQILEAYEVHGKNFIQINFDSIRKYREYAQYIDISVKLADGTVSAVRHWKISNDGIVVASRIRKPEQRKDESIRLGISLANEDGVVNENVKALKLLCMAFEEKMAELKKDNFITDDARAPRKQPDGTYRPVHLINTKIMTPMQTVAKNKENDDNVELDNPYFWISIPKKKFYNNDEKPMESVHYENKYYVDDSSQPDMTRPIMTHEYAPTFYNVDDFYHHPRTGKKIYNRLGSVNAVTENTELINTNIQDYLTKGSALMGNFKFEIAVSGRQCKLDVALHGSTYVKVAEQIEGEDAGQDDENVSAFTDRYSTISIKSGNDDSPTAADNVMDDYGDEE